MRWSKIAVVYAVASILAVYLYVRSGQRSQANLPDAEALAPLVQADPSSVDAVKIESADATVFLERRDGRWRVTQVVDRNGRPEVPAKPGEGNAEAHRVSGDLVDALIETFITVPPIEMVSEGGAPAQFGLDPPGVVVSMIVGSTPLPVIEIGNRSPTATAVYARRRGASHVYLVGLNARYYVELLWDEVLSKKKGTG